MTTPVCPAPAGPPQSPTPEDTHPVTLTTPEAVAQWLRTLAPEEICGHPRLPHACPLAGFLNGRNGDRGASVGSASYELAGERYPVPAWAQYFVARVDHAPGRWKRLAAQGLTVAEALRLLEGLCASRLDGLTGWMDGDGPVDGGAAACGQDGVPPPWLWPLLSLPS